MNLQFYIEQVDSSNIFKKFMKQNPKAYLCSGFFTIDKENKGKGDQKHLDFYIPDKKEMFVFKITANGVEQMPVEMTSDSTPEKLSARVNFDFDEVEDIILSEMVNNKINNKIQKILISLQRFKSQEMLICTVFISMLGLLKVHINPQTKKVELFEKKSLFDLVRRVK